MRRKGLLIVCLAAVLVLSLVAACAPAAGPAPEAPMKPQKWDCMMYMAGLTTFTDIQLQAAFGRIKERTNGLLDIRLVPHGGLPIKSEEWLRAVSAGELEMTEASGEYHSGDYPFLAILDIPFLFTNKLEKRMIWEAARPIVQREMNKVNVQVLAYHAIDNQCFCANKPVDVMDLKGLKVRSYSAMTANMITAMKGVPVPVAWPEVYGALEKGVADALLTGASAIYEAKLHEVAPYSYDIGLLNGIWYIAVNKDLWDALPCSVKEIVFEELAQYQGLSIIYNQMEMGRTFDKMLAAGGKGHEKAPPEFFDLMWEEVSKVMMEEEVAKSGAVGEEILAAIEQALGRKLI